MSNKVFAIAEHDNGTFKKVTYETLSEGKRLADQLGSTLTAVVLGDKVAQMAADLSQYGCDQIIAAENPALAEYLTDTYTGVLADLIQDESPSVVLLGATAQGKDLAARLAARLDAGLAMDCIAVRIENDDLVVTRPVYGGKLLSAVRVAGNCRMVAIRPNAMAVTKAAGTGDIEQRAVTVAPSALVLKEKRLDTDKIELTEADIVVSGGRGMGGNDYAVVEALAAALGAAVGASRSAVDEGWRPHSDQVGQTGKTVSPNLYVACGISGAIQHLAGMSSSNVIVAINKDPEAPIFSKADYGIVGDLFDVVPAITTAVKKMKS